MKRRETTVEDLRACYERLKGPLGVTLKEAGKIIARRLHEVNRDMQDLSNQELADVFFAAFMEAAPIGYPHVPRAKLDAALDDMFDHIAMLMAANADGGETRN